MLVAARTGLSCRHVRLLYTFSGSKVVVASIRVVAVVVVVVVAVGVVCLAVRRVAVVVDFVAQSVLAQLSAQLGNNVRLLFHLVTQRRKLRLRGQQVDRCRRVVGPPPGVAKVGRAGHPAFRRAKREPTPGAHVGARRTVHGRVGLKCIGTRKCAMAAGEGAGVRLGACVPAAVAGQARARYQLAALLAGDRLLGRPVVHVLRRWLSVLHSRQATALGRWR